MQEARRPVPPIILQTFFVMEKFLYFQDHHPTGSSHILYEHENMQSTWFLKHTESLHVLRSCGSRVVPLGQTDRRDKPNSRVSQILRALTGGSEMNSVRSGTITNGDL
jgi:hypothetical protein